MSGRDCSPSVHLLAPGVARTIGSVTIVDPSARDEQSRVTEVEARLRARFPHLPGDEVARAVLESHRELDDAPVRDFVPILVEKRARQLLDGMPRRQSELTD